MLNRERLESSGRRQRLLSGRRRGLLEEDKVLWKKTRSSGRRQGLLEEDKVFWKSSEQVDRVQ